MKLGEALVNDPEIKQMRKEWKEKLDVSFPPFTIGKHDGIEGYKKYLKEAFKKELLKKGENA